jgi:MYXO-CTERM domain-containing protein
LANTASQEAGHAWGLDHTLNCNSVMSYCGGFTTDGRFSDTCDALCEEQCQGANSIGCRLNHETHCGEGSNAQNEDLELNYLFGGNEPDMQPPVCEILSPADGDHFASGASTSVRVEVDDDYGGMGWQVTIAKDGETVYDEIDFFKENIDADFNAALNLTMLEPATYTVTALCIDHGDNMGEHTITFTVGDAAPPETGGMGSTGGDATGNVGDDTAGQGDTGDEDDDDDTGTGTVPRGDGDGDKGCGCFVRNQGRPGWNWLALGLLAFVARRRRSL